MKPLRADILAIGSELLHGGRVDSNSLFIADMVAHCGIRVSKKMALSDEQADIQGALWASSKQADVVILTGGLGSTVDDRTREAVAATFGRPLAVRRKAMQILKRQVHGRGRIVTPLLARQALMPSGAIVLDNLVGTAPGFYIQQRVSPLFQQPSVIALSLLASTKGVKVTLSCWRPKIQTSKTSKAPQIFPEGDNLKHQVRKTLEPWLFSEGEQTMEEVVGQLCSSHKWNLALAESCTGGLIAHRLTDVPGSSTYLDRGVVTYSNKAKQELLGVSPKILRKYGAVSAQVAEAMAKGIREKSRVDLGVSVTGIAGPGGGSAKKPVGMVYLAIDGPHGSQSDRKSVV
jgi:nicotinamide-nucleotide amidase